MDPFIFDPNAGGDLLSERIGHSELERYPLCIRNDELFAVLPTAFSAAIRRYVVATMESLSARENFARTLAEEYAECLSGTPLLGSRPPLEFQRTKNGLFAGALKGVDEGRYRHAGRRIEADDPVPGPLRHDEGDAASARGFGRRELSRQAGPRPLELAGLTIGLVSLAGPLSP